MFLSLPSSPLKDSSWAPAILVLVYILEGATPTCLLAFALFISSIWNPSLPGRLLLLLSFQVLLPRKPFFSHPKFWLLPFFYTHNTLYLLIVLLSFVVHCFISGLVACLLFYYKICESRNHDCLVHWSVPVPSTMLNTSETQVECLLRGNDGCLGRWPNDHRQKEERQERRAGARRGEEKQEGGKKIDFNETVVI